MAMEEKGKSRVTDRMQSSHSRSSKDDITWQTGRIFH